MTSCFSRSRIPVVVCFKFETTLRFEDFRFEITPPSFPASESMRIYCLKRISSRTKPNFLGILGLSAALLAKHGKTMTAARHRIVERGKC